jgi:prepilin-type N-terminal cleavage/methylation domain-containing protein
MTRSKTRGFTLIEIAVVLAIIAIVATISVGYARSGMKNANVSSTAYDVALRASGLRATAMAENVDYLLVVLDAKNNDASGCRWTAQENCVQAMVLKAPVATWSLSSFDPASLGTNEQLVETSTFGTSVAFDLASSPALPAPFSAVTLRDPDLFATCPNNRKCFAIRYRSSGDVVPEYAGSTQPRKLGSAFILRPDGGGTEHRTLVVSFPTGIVKSLAF